MEQKGKGWSMVCANCFWERYFKQTEEGEEIITKTCAEESPPWKKPLFLGSIVQIWQVKAKRAGMIICLTLPPFPFECSFFHLPQLGFWAGWVGIGCDPKNHPPPCLVYAKQRKGRLPSKEVCLFLFAFVFHSIFNWVAFEFCPRGFCAKSCRSRRCASPAWPPMTEVRKLGIPITLVMRYPPWGCQPPRLPFSHQPTHACYSPGKPPCQKF